jgi:hypothetical protein
VVKIYPSIPTENFPARSYTNDTTEQDIISVSFGIVKINHIKCHRLKIDRQIAFYSTFAGEVQK